jgi:hypothetical protein
MLKITHLEKEKTKHGNSSRILVKFEGVEISDLGRLGEYTKAIVIPDIAALEKFRDEQPPFDLEKSLVKSDDGEYYEYKPQHPSSFDLGLRKFMDVEGSDIIFPVEGEEGTFKFEEYVLNCSITQAVYEQLEAMKKELEHGICSFGNYPEQVGCFRSGEVTHDFALLLETLYNYWD